MTVRRNTLVMKYYNPYPFNVRILNDLAEIYVMKPQDYSKVMNKKYTQSVLSLPLITPERVYKIGLDVVLEDLKKDELIRLAWAVCIDGMDEKSTKAQLIEAIKEKLGEDYILTREEVKRMREREEEERELLEKDA